MGDDVRPLAGIRVIELSIAIAAPACGFWLAHHGAEVIKVESANHPDVARMFGSAWARADERAMSVFHDTSPYLAELNSGKKSLGLDLKTEGGNAAMRKVLAGADVFVTNFSMPAIASLGLSPAALTAEKPDLVYVALPGFGTDAAAPYYEYLAWGPNQAPLVGLDSFTGHPDQEPAGIAPIAPPDYNSAMHATLAVLVALEHRDRTGQGCLVDIAQFETTVSLLAPFLLDLEMTGRDHARDGNRLAWSAPEGVYPTTGEDRWVAISVTSDEAWAAACEVMGLGDPSALATAADRYADQDRLDAAIAAWTAQRSADDAAASLQSRGVAAHPVQDNEALIADAQVRDRGWYRVRPSLRMGRELLGGQPVGLSDPVPDVEFANAAFGEHTRELLVELAGLTDDEVTDLVGSGAAFEMTDPSITLRRPFDAWMGVVVPGCGDDDVRAGGPR
jgi:benzylsuccinate CoA-transferase BbsF subunit